MWSVKEAAMNKAVEKQGGLWYDCAIKIGGKKVKRPFRNEKNSRTKAQRDVTANQEIPAVG